MTLKPMTLKDARLAYQTGNLTPKEFRLWLQNNLMFLEDIREK